MTNNTLIYRAPVSMAVPAMWNDSCGQRTFVSLVDDNARALDRRRAG